MRAGRRGTLRGDADIGMEVDGAACMDPAVEWPERDFFNIMCTRLAARSASTTAMSELPGTGCWSPGGWYELQPDDISAARAIRGQSGDPSPNLAEARRLFEATSWAISWRVTAGDNTPVANRSVADKLFAGGFGADSIDGGYGNDTLPGNGLCRTCWSNPAHLHWSRSDNGVDDRDTIDCGSGNTEISGKMPDPRR